MRKKTTWFGMTGILVIAVLLGAFSQSGEDLFQKALRLERNEGKLMEAIELYNRVVAEGGNEALAAQAQLRIGLCFEKMGQKSIKQAQEAFQKVIDNFPEQKEAVKVAQEKLSVFLKAKAAMEKPGKELTMRKVWQGTRVDVIGGISPDGKYLCLTDWNTGDLAIRDLATGKNRRITDKGSWIKSYSFAIFSRWSPDGQSIAYSWYNHDTDRFELRLIGLESPQPRILIENKEKEYGDVIPFDWHPDGKHILVGLDRGGHSLELVFLSVADTKIRIVKTFDGIIQPTRNFPWGFVISPDGRTIVYDFHSDKNLKNRDIFMLSSDGEHEQKLFDHPAYDFVCDWAADGRHLLFASDRTGDMGLWGVQIEGGKALAAPFLIKADMGMFTPVGCTQQNQLYIGYHNEGLDIYMAEIDPGTGQFMAPPVKQVRLYEGCNALPEFSLDGKYFSYITKRVGTPQTKYSLCVYSFEKDEIREINTGLAVFNMFSTPQWRPDGKAISVIGIDRKDQRGIHLIELESETPSPLVLYEKNEVIRCHKWADDGQTLFYTKGDRKLTHDRKTHSLIYTLDLKTKQEKVLLGSPENAVDIDISPDGKWLVVLNREVKRTISLIQTAGGVSKELYSFDVMDKDVITPAWSADGKYIYFSSKSISSGREWDMWRLSLEDRRAKKIDLNTVSFRHPSIHPDGRHFIFSTEYDATLDSEVWMIENILPKSKKR